jgi:hypothetical protein
MAGDAEDSSREQAVLARIPSAPTSSIVRTWETGIVGSEALMASRTAGITLAGSSVPRELVRPVLKVCWK